MNLSLNLSIKVNIFRQNAYKKHFIFFLIIRSEIDTDKLFLIRYGNYFCYFLLYCMCLRY